MLLTFYREKMSDSMQNSCFRVDIDFGFLWKQFAQASGGHMVPL